MEGLGSLSTRRPRAVVAGWIAAVAALFLAGSLAPFELSPVRLIVPGSESDRAEELFEDRFGELETKVAVALTGPAATIDRRGPALADRLEALGLEVLSPWDGRELRSRLRPDPGSAVLAVSFTRPSDAQREAIEERVASRARQAGSDGRLEVSVSGPGFVGRALEDSALTAVHRAELLALPILLVVLLLVFRSPSAAAIPLLLGFGTVVAANGLVALLAGPLELNLFAVTLAAMIGLALGVDYSLLIVSRFREELAGSAHGDIRAAASATARTAGRTVLVAGLALGSSMLAGLLVAPGGVLFSAVGGALAAAIVGAGSAALVGPALLVLLGRRLATGSGSRPVSPLRLPRWMGMVRGVTARPGITTLLLVPILLALAAPALQLETGPPDPEQLPTDDPARVGFEAVRESIGPGWTSPLFAIVASNEPFRPSQRGALSAWARRIEADRDVAAIAVASDDDRRTLRATIVPRGGPNDESTRGLHSRLLDAADQLESEGVEVAVGGQPAEFADFREALAGRAPFLVGAIVLATGLVLLVVFRSASLPLIAIALNLLGVGASFGALALLFGGEPLLGGPGFIDVVSLAGAFTVVFGLSIDYYVFLIARMREEHDSHRDHRGAILRGIASTGTVVTGAATIMVAVFGAFALAEMAAIRQLGVALSIAVLLDATLIRLLLLPAAISLLGPRVWRSPRSLVRASTATTKENERWA